VTIEYNVSYIENYAFRVGSSFNELENIDKYTGRNYVVLFTQLHPICNADWMELNKSAVRRL